MARISMTVNGRARAGNVDARVLLVHFLREQLRLTLEELTRRLPGLRPADDRPVTMRPTMIHRSPESLHLTW